VTRLTHLLGVKRGPAPADTGGVGPDLSTSGTRTACPSCGGRLRPEATFCGQCYADFRPPPPAPAVPLAPAPTAAYGTPAPDPLTAPLLDVVLPVTVPAQATAPVHLSSPAAKPGKTPTGWPCSRCEAVNDFTDVLCTVCGSPFLAKVAEETKVTLVLPVVGDLSRYSRGQRAIIAFVAVLALLVPLALITLLLTDGPSSSGKATGGGSSSSSTTTTTTGSG